MGTDLRLFHDLGQVSDDDLRVVLVDAQDVDAHLGARRRHDGAQLRAPVAGQHLHLRRVPKFNIIPPWNHGTSSLSLSASDKLQEKNRKQQQQQFHQERVD